MLLLLLLLLLLLKKHLMMMMMQLTRPQHRCLTAAVVSPSKPWLQQRAVQPLLSNAERTRLDSLEAWTALGVLLARRCEAFG